MSDMIKREDVIAVCDVLPKLYGEAIKLFIKRLPSADRLQGEWIAVDSLSAFGGSAEQWYAHGNPIAFHYCSNCKEQVRLDEFGQEMLTSFCPYCGAKMKGEREEEE